ncbi:DUF262 domain-containing protein [Lactococcus lactis subsp. lactis]|uniref:DUF262 domain-containing protein n=1 Tax=Lactococcus lactis TaxID=1358 RepID=UPI00300E5611
MQLETKKEILNKIEFKKSLSNYLCIDEDKIAQVDITYNQEEIAMEEEFNIYASYLENTYIVNVKIDDNEYDFIGSENINNAILSEKTNFDIDYWSYNITYDQLSRLYESDKIKIPDMQRGFVWDDIQASRLIESILMGLPLPSLFLIKNIEEGDYMVVDGLQRITSIHAFRYNRRLPNRKSIVAGFSLKGVNAEIVNKTYDDLLAEGKTDKFDMGTINVIEFKQNKPDHEEAMYTLFERLNGGGTNLSPQQIRNSIYYGIFNDLLNENSSSLGKYFSSKAILSLAPSENMLRIISIYEKISKDYNSSIPEDFEEITNTISYKRLYNETCSKYHMEYKTLQRIKNEEKEREFRAKLDLLFIKIKKAIKKVEEIFGDNSFVRYEYKKSDFVSRFSPVLLEGLVVTILLNEERDFRDNDSILESFKNMFDEENNFDKYFTQGTGRLRNVLGRIKSIEEVFYEPRVL